MPQPVASGWQLVPVEPTAAMLAAVSSYGKDQLAADAIWRAMLAATPPTPASEVAQDAARYRFLFLEEDWCRDPLWPLVAFFRDGNSIPKAQVDAAIDAALNQGERHGDSGSKTA
jgi:hypothetical protein